MSHLPALPILIAAFAGFLLMLLERAPLGLQRRVSLIATAAGVAVAVTAFGIAVDGEPRPYALGNWPAPFGIFLVLDRLSALMVLLTAVTAMGALLAAVQGWDRRGRMFHALFQFQIMGIQGAFLTGDIFNLFVFFEILLIASYGLLLHGGGAERARAGIKYVVVNLTGSALFLVGVALLYGVTGTLNMADLAMKIPEVPAADQGLLKASALVLLVVFGVKAALLPLFFWLPDAYSAASSPVAALFAVMTKIGVYAILRTYTLTFGGIEGGAGAIVAPWLLTAALLTLVAGMLGALAARRLRGLAAYLTVASVGTILVPVALFTVESVAASLYYMTHSVLVTAALFLLAEPIEGQRGELGDRLEAGTPVHQFATLGLLYMAVAVAMAGLPPLSGFLGKALILDSVLAGGPVAVVWAVILVTSLIAVVALARAGSRLFWKTEGAPAGGPASPMALMPVGVFTALIVALTLNAGAFEGFARATARDLLEPSIYIEAVLANDVVVEEGP